MKTFEKYGEGKEEDFLLKVGLTSSAARSKILRGLFLYFRSCNRSRKVKTNDDFHQRKENYNLQVFRYKSTTNTTYVLSCLFVFICATCDLALAVSIAGNLLFPFILFLSAMSRL